MPRTRKPLAPEVTELLLISKSILDRLRTQISAMPHRDSIAINILLAHDAAELALAAIANQCEKLPVGNQHYLMHYFASLKTLHPKSEVVGHGYFDQLNRVRVNLKHKGIFPDPDQWARVGEKVYEYVSAWCSKYLSLNLDDLDRSVLLTDPEVKVHYARAQTHFVRRQYKEVMEELAWTLQAIFEKKPALRGISVGKSNAEHAIRLAAFGVQANDFIRLQQFLPQVLGQQVTKLIWTQNEYGHPGNWHEEAARFCLNTVVDIAVKLQAAAWIPGPVPFFVLYDYKLEAIKDDVEIWNLPEGNEYTFDLSGNRVDRKLIKTLSKGETLDAILVHTDKKERGLLGLLQEKNPKKEEVSIIATGSHMSGYVARDEVKITCIPHKEYFADLPEIEWLPPN